MSMSLQDWNGLKDIQNQICWKEGETEQKATKSGCFEETEGTRQQSQQKHTGSTQNMYTICKDWWIKNDTKFICPTLTCFFHEELDIT